MRLPNLTELAEERSPGEPGRELTPTAGNRAACGEGPLESAVVDDRVNANPFEHRGQAGRCPLLGPYLPMEQKSRISHKWPVGNAFGPLWLRSQRVSILSTCGVLLLRLH